MKRKRVKLSNIVKSYQEGNRSFALLDLAGLKFEASDLTDIHFSDCDLRGTSFKGGRLAGSRFTNVLFGRRPAWHLILLFWLILLTVTALVMCYGAISWSAELAGLSIPGLRGIANWFPYLLGLAAYIFTSEVQLRRGWLWATILLSTLTAFGLTLRAAGYLANHAGKDPTLAPFGVLGQAMSGTLGALLTLPFGLLIGVLLSIAIAFSIVAVAIVWTSLRTRGRHFVLSLGVAAYIALLLCFDGARWILEMGVAAAAALFASWRLSGRILNGDARHSLAQSRTMAYRRWKGTSFQGATLIRADLAGLGLAYTDLRDAKIARTDFKGVHGLEHASLNGVLARSDVRTLLCKRRGTDGILDGCDLRDLNLADSEFAHALLNDTDFRDADLSGANFTQAVLNRANFQGANLSAARLDDASMVDARIDVLTYQRSGWNAERVEELHRRYVEIVGLETFPAEVRERIVTVDEGLTLTFSSRLLPMHRFVLDGLILAVLGRESSCRVVEYHERQNTAIVRLRGSSRDDLERVAEALYERLWETERANSGLAMELAELLSTRILRDV